MGRIIAIGGGDLKTHSFPKKGTFLFDREIVKLTGKKKPKLLFIPTASRDSKGYIDNIQKYFGKKLNCEIDNLLTVNEKPSIKVIKEKILSSDIIYVGGGNTLYMVKRWKKLGIDKILWQAYQKGIVMSGVSAGAICWFKYGTSDSRMMTDPTFKDYIRVSGLGWFNIILSPHHLAEKKRKASLIKQIKKHGGIGLALDDLSAIEIINDEFRIITHKTIAKAHKAYMENKKLYYKPIVSNKFFPIHYLTTK